MDRTILKIDPEIALDDDERLIGIPMVVPNKIPV